MSRRNSRGIATRNSRNGLVFLLIFSLVLLLGACKSTLTETSVEPGKENFHSPMTIPYLVRNPLEIKASEEIREGQNTYIRTLKINGLADKTIEEGINMKLQEAYTKMLEGKIPPYRGIRQIISDKSRVTGVTLDASMGFNYNNVISVLLYGNRSYEAKDVDERAENPQAEVVQVGTMEAYTIDLNTGNPIQLKELFADNVDYKKVLNDYISEKLEKGNAPDEEIGSIDMMYGGFKLVAPFKGISDDQKFFLYQGGIGLIFDYTTPEFDTHYYANTMYVGFKELGDVIAVTERFYDPEKDLYVSEKPPVYEFVQQMGLNEVRVQRNETIDGINIFQTINHSKELPEPVLDKIKVLSEIDRETVSSMKLPGKNGAAGLPGMEWNVWAGQTGEYTTVSRNIILFNENQWENRSENYCFDGEGNLLKLEDLFVPDYDYETRIQKALGEALRQNPVDTGALLEPEQLYQSLQFALGISEISFTSLPLQMQDGSRYPLNFMLTYEEIGCDHLTLFP